MRTIQTAVIIIMVICAGNILAKTQVCTLHNIVTDKIVKYY